nr:uncharacterized protein LOC109147362 [Ipomoea batatas]
MQQSVSEGNLADSNAEESPHESPVENDYTDLPQPRRSTRTRIMPNRLQDYICQATKTISDDGRTSPHSITKKSNLHAVFIYGKRNLHRNRRRKRSVAIACENEDARVLPGRRYCDRPRRLQKPSYHHKWGCRTGLKSDGTISRYHAEGIAAAPFFVSLSICWKIAGCATDSGTSG